MSVSTRTGQSGQLLDLTGNRKGTWTAVRLLPKLAGHTNRHWLVRCDCGREKSINTTNWRSGRGTRRCACMEKAPNYNQLPDGVAAFNVLYSQYVTRANRRGLSFELTKDEFRSLTQADCTYCGEPPHQTRITATNTAVYVYTGVDRIDSSLGYVAGNCTPCCGICNRSKSDMTTRQFKDHIRRMWDRRDTW